MSFQGQLWVRYGPPLLRKLGNNRRYSYRRMRLICPAPAFSIVVLPSAADTFAVGVAGDSCYDGGTVARFFAELFLTDDSLQLRNRPVCLLISTEAAATSHSRVVV